MAQGKGRSSEAKRGVALAMTHLITAVFASNARGLSLCDIRNFSFHLITCLKSTGTVAHCELIGCCTEIILKVSTGQLTHLKI
jgi:hypothetical protein